MNIAMICRILGLTLGVEAAFMIPPLAIALARHEHSAAVGFAVTVAAIPVSYTDNEQGGQTLKVGA